MSNLKEQIANERKRLNEQLKAYMQQIFGEQSAYQIDVSVTDIDLNEEIRVSLTNQNNNGKETTNQRFTITRTTQTDEKGNVTPDYMLKTIANAQGYDHTTETTTLKTMPAQISVQVINIIMQVIEQFVKENTEDENSESESDKNVENANESA